MNQGMDPSTNDSEQKATTGAPPSPLQPSSSLPAETYVCPVSKDVVSRGVHLSRLRRGYEECADCPHRGEAGNLPLSRASRSSVDDRGSWLRRDGLRATYLNQLTRPVMSRLAEVAAAMFWDDLGGGAGGKPPITVVGRDSRPMSADLEAGAASGLRRMGCHVIEVGEVTRPEFWFAARHLESFAGLWITGVGADASCGGIDIMQGGRCWSSPGRLDELWTRRESHLTRPAGRNGTLATFQANRAYLAGLRKHFHAFRPLSLLIAYREGKLQRYLQSLLDDSPIVAHWHMGPAAVEQAGGRQLIAAIQEQIYSQRLDAVISIDDDLQTCHVWDERGRSVPPVQLLRPLLEVIDRRRTVLATRQPPGVIDAARPGAKWLGPAWLQARAAFARSQGSVIDEQSVPHEAEEEGESTRRLAARAVEAIWRAEGENNGKGDHSSRVVVSDCLREIGSLGSDIIGTEDTLESMSRAMSEHHARLGLDYRGAFWFDESGPMSDALLTVARLLQLLSQSDQPLSRHAMS